MITKVNNSISNLKNLWIELFIDKTNKVTNVADGSVLNATAYGTAKVAQKAIKDIAIVESQIFPESATGTLLDKSAALFGVTPRKGALGSSTYVRVLASPGTVYGLSTYFIAKNGTRFIVDKELIVDGSGYGYVSVRSTVTGSSTNVEANSITQVTPRPLTHIECVNEYQAIGGRDYEDDETFRTRIKNNDNKLSKGTVEYWTQVFQDLDSRVLRVMNVGLGEDAKTHIYLVTQNGSFFTEDELSTLLAKASSYFGLFEIDLSGNSIGIVLENAEWMYVGGATGVDFRVELTPGAEITTVRKNIQIALTKYLDFRFWSSGKTVQWDDLLQVVKTATGVKYVPDEFFNPFYDETVPLNQLPRIRGFIMRDLNGLVLFDAGLVLSNIFYPAGDSNIYTGQQSQTLSQTQVVQVTVTNTRGAVVDGAVFSVGGKIVITNSEGQAQLLLENGEYDYTLSKNGWNQQTGSFIVLNAKLSIIINDFTATLQTVSFEILQISTPIDNVTVAISNQTLITNPEGKTSIDLEPGTYSYSLTKVGYTPVLNAVVVDTLPVKITEYMFPQAQAVSFSVIDRERDIFVPNASVWVQDITEDTDNNGQAEMNLTAGSYNLIIQRSGYLQYEETIDISGVEKNCILVELTAIPYQTRFTVLNQETNLPITSASIAVNGSGYTTNNQGIAIVSLPDGSYLYEVVKSGFSTYSGTVLVNGGETGVVIRMNKAFWKTTFIVRDIDTGIFLQGALANVNDKSGLTDVNGEAEFSLSNGTYPYSVSLAEYKESIGEVIVFDQDTEATVFMKPKGRVISFVAKDSITKAIMPGVQILISDKGTGTAIITLNTNSEGRAEAELDRGGYKYVASKEGYSDKEGTFDVDLSDFEIEVLMEIKPIKVSLTYKAENEIVNNTGVPIGASTIFTSKSTGEVVAGTPVDENNDVNVFLKPDVYSCLTSGPGIATKEEPLTIQYSASVSVTFTVSLTKEAFFELFVNIPGSSTPADKFYFTENAEVTIYRGQRGFSFKTIFTVNDGPGTRIRTPTGYFLPDPTYYSLNVTPASNTKPTKGSLIFWKYYSPGTEPGTWRINADTQSPITAKAYCMITGIIRLILQNETGQTLPAGEKFAITITRVVTGDFPYTKTVELTSINRNGVTLIEATNLPYGEYQITLASTDGRYKSPDIFTGEMSNQNNLFEKTLELEENQITILVQTKSLGFGVPNAEVQIRDLIPPAILSGPVTTNATGLATLSLFYRAQDSNLNILAGAAWNEYLQPISLRGNQSIEVDLVSTFKKILKIFLHYESDGILSPHWQPETNVCVNWANDANIYIEETTGTTHAYLAGDYTAMLYALMPLKVDLTNQISVTSIKSFKDMTSISATGSGLVSADVSESPDLDTFVAVNCKLTSLDLTSNNKIKQINANKNALTDFRIGETASDVSCEISENLLSSFDMGAARIKILYIKKNPLLSLNLNKSTVLNFLDCSETKLENLTLSQQLQTVYCLDSQLTTITINNNPNLKVLNIVNNKLLTVDITLNAGITAFRCGGNQISSLDLSKNISLQYFECSSNKLTALDVSRNFALFNIDCSNNPFILDDLAIVAFANSLANRSSQSTAGVLKINNAEQAAKIKSICDAKKWNIS